MDSRRIILAFIAATVVVSGCTTGSPDVTAAAESLPEVQEFLDENPDADITAVRWNSDYLQDNKEQIPEKCKPAIDMEKDHYKVDVQDGEDKIKVWLGAEQKEVMCLIREGPESTENQTSESEEPSETYTADMTPEETFRQISSDLNLDTEGLMQCYNDSDNQEANEDRDNINREVGNIGTPTFFIGNKEKGFIQVTGAQPLSEFDDAIDRIKSEDSNNSGELVTLESVELEGEPSKGDENAEIKVLEYNDFGCPFCAEWQGIDASSRTPIDERNIGPEFEKKYVDTGEVEFIMKDMPVPQLHPNGPKAHQFANCVYENEQDSYWDVHDQLFEKRDSWMQE